MSISLLLVPLAVAGAAAVKAASDRGADGVCHVHTRMRDVTLLADALRDTGAEVATAEERLTARWEAVEAVFTRDAEGIWGAHFTGADQARAVELVTAVDVAYGRRVQRTVLDRLRDQAPAAGLRLESETVDENAGVRLVFEVERQ
ncbi:MAG TPA: hypothetical protein VN408_12740 [Actinoplanes sp.]|nr:hypothetical protein [Actinoplanes sp.]